MFPPGGEKRGDSKEKGVKSDPEFRNQRGRFDLSGQKSVSREEKVTSRASPDGAATSSEEIMSEDEDCGRRLGWPLDRRRREGSKGKKKKRGGKLRLLIREQELFGRTLVGFRGGKVHRS